MGLRAILLGILIGLLMAGAGARVYIWWDSREDEPDPFQRLAVLTLVDSGGDASELGGMIAQELTTQLTQMGLPVIPWIRTQGYSPEEVDEAGDELGADGVVAGPLSVENGRVRGTVRLHDRAGGSRGWKLEIDVSRGDLLITARYIAGKIARRFEGNEAPDPEAQSKVRELLLDGGDALWEVTEEGDERAREIYIEVLGIDPGNVEAYIGLATSYFQQDSDAAHQEALAMYELALELDPASAPARRGLIMMYWAMGLKEKTLAVVKAMPEDMDRFDRVMIAGDAYVKSGLATQAIPFYEEALSLKPGDPGAKWGLAPSYTWSGRYREAVELQLEYFEEHGDNAWLYHFTAGAYFGLGLVDSSIYFAEKSVNLGHSNAEGYLADLHESKGDHEKARELREVLVRRISDQLSQNPNNHRARTQRAEFYAKLGHRDKYLADMELAIKHAKGDGSLCWNIGFTMAEVGEVTRAIDFLRQGLELGHWVYQPAIRAAGKGQQFLAAENLMKHPDWPALEAEILAKEEELWKKYGIE